MEVTKVALGHTTNSSSSHSIVILNSSNSMCDVFPQLLDSDFEYGWENFVLASPVEKNKYLFAQLHIALSKIVGPTTRETILSKLFGSIADTYKNEECYIDHQSIISFPCEFGYNTLDLDFVKEFCYFLQRDDVVVIGGNDNEGAFVVPNTKGYFDKLIDHYGFLTCRKDDGGWTLFNKNTGATITVSFSNKEAVKYISPLIVDISITDFCDIGCKFCYRGSTVKGKHADFYDVSKIIAQLKKMKVFSVAIGGGEPTTHPDFRHILSTFRDSGINVSFTTRSTTWMVDKEIRDAVDEHVSAIGFSVSTSKGVEKLAESCKIAAFPTNKIVLHVIAGISDTYVCKSIIKSAKQYGFGGVLLLGYKTTGRGKTVEPAEVNLIKVLDGDDNVDISIDTCLAAKWQEKLNERGIPQVLYSVKEGVSSCFIDAVNLKVAQSSFGGKEENFAFGYKDSSAIFDAWKKIRECV